jgi:hypothetical protein
MTEVTPEQFWSWDRPQQQAYLAGASGRKALAVGVAAICGDCGQPLRRTGDGHQCDPAHLAEALAKLRAGLAEGKNR